MKIEKVNDNQIRCTLTREDLASRQLKISELAYGSEKAKSLFRDMMKQANTEFGFEAEDIPLMIEAIPLNGECIVLIITKVEDPEELDTRFSRFAPSGEETEEDDEYREESAAEAPEDVLELFRRIQEQHTPAEESSEAKEEQTPPAAPMNRIYRMPTLQAVWSAAQITGSYFTGESALYKDDHTGEYLLSLTQGSMRQDDFNRFCNVLSEYGQFCRNLSNSQSYLEEHFTPLVSEKALNSLAV